MGSVKVWPLFSSVPFTKTCFLLQLHSLHWISGRKLMDPSLGGFKAIPKKKKKDLILNQTYTASPNYKLNKTVFTPTVRFNLVRQGKQKQILVNIILPPSLQVKITVCPGYTVMTSTNTKSSTNKRWWLVCLTDDRQDKRGHNWI